MQKFSVKGDIYFGIDAVSKIEDLNKNRVFIVTDELMVKIGAVDKVTERLKKDGTQYEIFSRVKPDPSVEIVAQGVKAMRKFAPDVVVAVGGGSAIDTAKTIQYALWQMNVESGKDFRKPVFVAVPTTSGTGSEVTSFSIVTIGSGKLALIDDWMVPDIALVDPQFVTSVPPSVTADTGLDVLCHALEAYVSTKAMDFTDALSEKIVKIVFDYLLEAYKNGKNEQAREKMHNASCMAGVAFSNTSLGIIHSLAHALGGAFHIPHGRANAILMPDLISYNAVHDKRAEKRYADLAFMLGLQAGTPSEGCASLIKAINVIKEMLKVPMTISETGLEKEKFEEKLDMMANNAMNDSCMLTTPYKPTLEEVKQLYRQAYGK